MRKQYLHNYAVPEKEHQATDQIKFYSRVHFGSTLGMLAFLAAREVSKTVR